MAGGDPNSVIAQAPAWSASGLRAGSGLNRYTNFQPGSLRSMYGSATPAASIQNGAAAVYQSPALRSVRDRLGTYQQQAAAAQAAKQATLTASATPTRPEDHGGAGSAGGSGGYSSDGGDSGQSFGSALAGELGIGDAKDGAMSGYAIGGLPGAVIGGLLGHSQAIDPTNPRGVNATNGMDQADNVAVAVAPTPPSFATITDDGISEQTSPGIESMSGFQRAIYNAKLAQAALMGTAPGMGGGGIGYGDAGFSAVDGYGGFGIGYGQGFGGLGDTGYGGFGGYGGLGLGGFGGFGLGGFGGGYGGDGGE